MGRLILGLLIDTTEPIKLIGDKSLSKRDFKRITDPLTKFGATFKLKKNSLPLKMLGSSNPKSFNDLLKGANDAELALQSKAVEILKGVKPKDFAKLKPEEQKNILKEISSKGFVADEQTLGKFAEKSIT